MKKILIFLLIAIFILTSCNSGIQNTNSGNNSTNTDNNGNEQNNENPTNNDKDETKLDGENTTNEEKDTISITSETVALEVDDKEKITANTCKINVEAGDKYSDLKKTINEINTWIEDTAKKDLEMIYEYFNMDAESEIVKIYSLDDNISFIRQDDKYISFSLLRYENTGGPHPFTLSEGFTIDVETGKRLQLKDIVSSKDDLYDIIMDKLDKHEGKVAFYENYTDIVNKLFYSDDFTDTEFRLVWVIDNRTLYITLETYVIAPFATGPININISFNEVDNLFIDEIKEN